jgi:hypothetical protein
VFVRIGIKAQPRPLIWRFVTMTETLYSLDIQSTLIIKKPGGRTVLTGGILKDEIGYQIGRKTAPTDAGKDEKIKKTSTQVSHFVSK